MNQTEKAQHFKSLHIAGNPLVLYNIWDAGGAKTLADNGAVAVATGSWSVAAAQGFGDGEKIPLSLLMLIVERIAASVSLPLSVDFEGGYSIAPEQITANVQQLIRAGAIGLNFEDQVIGGKGLYSIAEQTSRLRAVRKAAELEDVPLFINSRTDLFLKSDATEHEALISETLERASAYADAGADGFFIPGLTQPALIEQICRGTNLPVNVMMKGELTSISELASLGVSRSSFGPGPYFDAMTNIAKKFKAIA